MRTDASPSHQSVRLTYRPQESPTPGIHQRVLRAPEDLPTLTVARPWTEAQPRATRSVVIWIPTMTHGMSQSTHPRRSVLLTRYFAVLPIIFQTITGHIRRL